MQRRQSSAVVSLSLLWAGTLLQFAVGADYLTGFATEYGGSLDGMNANIPSYGLAAGACGYGKLARGSWPYWMAAAVGPANPLAAASINKLGCGICIEIICNDPACAPTSATPAFVLVTDTCASCSPGQLNVHASVFEQRFSNRTGQVSVKYRQVPCTPPAATVVVSYAKPATNGDGFIRLAVIGVPGDGGIRAAQIRDAGSATWLPLENQYGATWQGGGLASNGPFDVQVVPTSGPALVALNAVPKLALGDYPASFSTGALPAAAPAPAPASPDPAPATPAQAPATLPLPVSAAAPAAATILPLVAAPVIQPAVVGSLPVAPNASLQPALTAANAAPTVSVARPAIPGAAAPSDRAAGPAVVAGPTTAASPASAAIPVAAVATPTTLPAAGTAAPTGAQQGAPAPVTPTRTIPTARPAIGTVLPLPGPRAPAVVPAAPAAPPTVVNVTAVGNSTYFSGSPLTTGASSGVAARQRPPAGPVQITYAPGGAAGAPAGAQTLSITWPVNGTNPLVFAAASSIVSPQVEVKSAG